MRRLSSNPSTDKKFKKKERKEKEYKEFLSCNLRQKKHVTLFMLSVPGKNYFILTS
jgi:hypothetical protein